MNQVRTAILLAALTALLMGIGYLLGGGLSFYGRAHGLAVNHVRAFDVVTADGARRRDFRPDPRAPGRRRSEHHGRGQRALRRGARGGGRRARGRHLPRRAPQLLRPQAGVVRRGVRGRMAAGPRLHRAARLAPSAAGAAGRSRPRRSATLPRCAGRRSSAG